MVQLKTSVTNMETKQNVRNLCKKMRKDMAQDQVSWASLNIHRKLTELEVLKNNDVILGYSSIQNEPDIFPFLQECLDNGKRVFLPKVINDNIFFFEVFDLSLIETGSYQILEPKEDMPYDSKLKGAVLVPGIAFDLLGNRIGFGKGFYDRFLNRNRNLYRIGIAHDFQTLYEWESDACDEKMDLIVTDKNEVLCDGIKKIM